MGVLTLYSSFPFSEVISTLNFNLPHSRYPRIDWMNPDLTDMLEFIAAKLSTFFKFVVIVPPYCLSACCPYVRDIIAPTFVLFSSLFGGFMFIALCFILL